MKTLATQDIPCLGLPCRTEVTLSVVAEGKSYNVTLRDKVAPEDPYVVMVKAVCFALLSGEPYVGKYPDRTVLDALIKAEVTI